MPAARRPRRSSSVRHALVLTAVMAGSVTAAATGHLVAERASHALSAASASMARVGSGLVQVPSQRVVEAAASSASQTGAAGAAATAAASPSASWPALNRTTASGLPAEQVERLSRELVPVAVDAASLLTPEQRTSACAAISGGGAAEERLRQSVRAQLPAADRAISDDQLDGLLATAGRSIC